MKNEISCIESLYERSNQYSKTTYELAKLKGLNTSTVLATSFISKLSTMLMFIMFMLLITIGVAMLIGDALGHKYYGLFIVSAFYLVLTGIMHLKLQSWINKSVSNLIITQVLQ